MGNNMIFTFIEINSKS